jgi:hypothetical protein
MEQLIESTNKLIIIVNNTEFNDDYLKNKLRLIIRENMNYLSIHCKNIIINKYELIEIY